MSPRPPEHASASDSLVAFGSSLAADPLPVGPPTVSGRLSDHAADRSWSGNGSDTDANSVGIRRTSGRDSADNGR
jgi:hypothetical protein